MSGRNFTLARAVFAVSMVPVFSSLRAYAMSGRNLTLSCFVFAVSLAPLAINIVGPS